MEDTQIPVDGKSEFTAVISNRGFRSLWIAQICSQIANNTLLFVLALNLYRLSSSNTAVSGLFLVYGIPAVAFGMAAGTIVDKLENRKVLIFCDLVRALLIIGLMIFHQSIAVIYILTFLNSLVTQFYVPAEAPTIPYLVPKKLLVTANSLFSFTYYSSLAIGSIFAGPLLKIMETKYVFLLLAVLFILAAFFVRNLPKTLDYNYPLKNLLKFDIMYLFRRLLANIRDGISYVQKAYDLKEALFLLMGTQVLIAVLATLGPGFADRVLVIDVRDSSLYVTGPAVLGIILGALWIGSRGDRINPHRFINIGINTAGISLLIIAVVFRISRMTLADLSFYHSVILPIAVSLFFILGLANSFLDVPSNSILQHKAVGEMRGRIYGMLTAAVGGIGFLPVVAGGILADYIGVGKVIFILGILITGYGIFRVKYNRKL
jgi:MFS family permease